ncbi:MAG TPA: tRNA (N6-isopentenyl adenosine(37)-C2)-methylthiotransferase MiaB [Solirubrobacterales bacterium]|jgi:tRNA-2-methylthio-N6-dimethylallyladenosine synthase|nr:tRNA (N6-isopentenyl adenosine(37)-C2)-methylthiotransferase MiaB [Solirubrobacterales bacterium]HMU26704.1 tRNA (N6-isopentenyl adenosine(37)-C2)-methylthiotransferase MiaB [Solirubrobacterales bacterium]HMY24701.1 tRNA (N6-isopentenyl adenosine(37)-C2)-methylthiotransferase MiaB [Solirubrobacterales bacterium]HNA23027.1 tRNA (N6-isopentenyl adenosine(37)-C2)-methylthiotransferase MiaB [Solirubrobacterales bacterium]HNA43386.1 tRNA (N6-isopentenyl adenosine(37)-C2)-methylthiotransferase Mia
MKKFHVTTFGCQMNEHDSERMKGMLTSLGYSESTQRDDADLILFNTCSIRENADNRFISHLGEAKRLKKADPERIVGVGGCWAQSVKDEVFRRFPFVDVAFGPGQIHKLAEFLNSDQLSAQGYFEFEDFAGHLPSHRARQFQGWLQISQGCNCVCSYCIVPSTRGREQSRDPRELLKEAERLAADGVREITLLGQNVNSYGRDLPKESRIRFSDLLGMIDAVDGIDRLRYTSPHPKDMREDVIEAHASLPSLCEHIHLPLQSGSSSILKKMRRTYTRERYMDRVAMIREQVPDCAITTDIIVGFPGETEEDFAETLEVVEEVGYDGAFTFVYSPRRGTLAAEMEDQIAHPVKVERMERLVEAVQRRARERAQRFVGRNMEVLVEGPSRNDPTRIRGRSRHNKAVNFEGTAEAGQMVEVEIGAATSQTLTGTERLLSGIGA